MRQVVEALHPEKVTTLDGAEEDITFVLPREFRDNEKGRTAKADTC